MTFLLGYLLLFAPDLKLIDLHFFIVSLFIIYNSVRIILVGKVPKYVLYSIFILVIGAYQAVVVNEYAVFGISVLFKAITYLICALFYLAILRKRFLRTNGDGLEILRWIFYWGTIDAIIPIIFAIKLDWYSAILPLIDLNMEQQISGKFSGIRFSNLSIAGGTLSLMYAISAISGSILIFCRSQNSTLYFLFLLVLICGMILTGRIGLFLYILVAFIIFALHSFLKIKKAKFLKIKKTKFIKLTIMYIIIIIVSIFSFSYVNREFKNIFKFAFEAFYNNGKIKSVERLFRDHIYYEYDSHQEFLFGHGTKLLSDFGYSNFLYTYGLILFCFLIAVYFILGWRLSLAKHSPTLLRYMALFVWYSYPVLLVKQFIFGNSKGLFILLMLLLLAPMYCTRRNGTIETTRST